MITSITTSIVSIFEWKCVQAAGQVPLGRYLHAAVVISNTYGEYMVIVGGTTTGMKSAESFTFSFERQEWKCLGSSTLLNARRGHCAAVLKGMVVVHGGQSNDKPLNDLQVLSCMSALPFFGNLT